MQCVGKIKGGQAGADYVCPPAPNAVVMWGILCFEHIIATSRSLDVSWAFQDSGNVAICNQLLILWDVRENCFGNCSLKKSCAPRNNWESISLGWWPAGSWPCTCELKTVPHAILGNVSFLLNSHLISLFPAATHTYLVGGWTMIMKVVSLGWDPSIAQGLGWPLQLSQMWITWLHNFCLGGSAYAHAPTHLLIKFWRGECPHVTVCFDIVHSYLPSPRGGQIWLVWPYACCPHDFDLKNCQRERGGCEVWNSGRVWFDDM